jgi:hypothetical protein
MLTVLAYLVLVRRAETIKAEFLAALLVLINAAGRKSSMKRSAGYTEQQFVDSSAG